MPVSPVFGGKSHYYFAYGSNMDPAQMKARCPESRFVSRATLENYDVDFTRFSTRRQCGVMDVVPKAGSRVWGALFKVSDNDINRMDAAEIYAPPGGKLEDDPHRYQRKTLAVQPEGDTARTPIQASVYEVVTKQPTIPPSKDYLDTILRGAEACGLPGPYIERLRGFSRFGR